MSDYDYDMIVIGGGPAGLNAALTAADDDARVLVIEREPKVGGACVQYGTIPSKTLRETAVTLTSFKRRNGGVYDIAHDENLQVASLMTRLNDVVDAHQNTMLQYLESAKIERAHGLASFVGPHEVSIESHSGQKRIVTGGTVVIATGSRPRNPPEIDVDHENILDSDSILAMSYLPQSVIVLGGGVIACEYAATYANLGVRVTMIDRYPTPLGFLDHEVVEGFVQQFERDGGRFIGNCKDVSIQWDGVCSVVAELSCGTEITSDKALIAQGRVANVDGLALDKINLATTDRGVLNVNEWFQTDVPWVYAVGDAIGPPALASASMEQGRRAANHALQRKCITRETPTPMGIYTIPEIASVGLDENGVRKEYDDVLVGRSDLARLARGCIMATSGGLLKIVADPTEHRIRGVQIVGDGATELIHVGQLAMAAEMTVEELASTIFNFPTLAEAYRVAALDLLSQPALVPLASSLGATCRSKFGLPQQV
ncbi:MAG: Si-specific NAD(P)(+) transhydrogenase [Planctomycetales bacterium]|nr:Si-specific NAD(P)(+) transhydrogenase [Planctomycetales bacterium]